MSDQINEFRKVVVTNFLDYEPVETKNYEWDNIPLVVPKMLLYIEKYL